MLSRLCLNRYYASGVTLHLPICLAPLLQSHCAAADARFTECSQLIRCDKFMSYSLCQRQQRSDANGISVQTVRSVQKLRLRPLDFRFTLPKHSASHVLGGASVRTCYYEAGAWGRKQRHVLPLLCCALLRP